MNVQGTGGDCRPIHILQVLFHGLRYSSPFPAREAGCVPLPRPASCARSRARRKVCRPAAISSAAARCRPRPQGGESRGLPPSATPSPKGHDHHGMNNKCHLFIGSLPVVKSNYHAQLRTARLVCQLNISGAAVMSHSSKDRMNERGNEQRKLDRTRHDVRLHRKQGAPRPRERFGPDKNTLSTATPETAPPVPYTQR
jgi:hypothetical protein